MNPDKYTEERILTVQPWTASLVSFRLSRPAGFRFTAGQFARLGLVRDDPHAPDGSGKRTIWRAYSIASATYHEYLEFCSVLLPDGEFTSELAKLVAGDTVLIEKIAYGFLTTASFAPGKDLWMIATGTGLAPFISMILEPQIWRDFENLVVVHSVREAAELAYRSTIECPSPEPSFGADAKRLHYVPIVTRSQDEQYLHERIPKLVEDGRLERAAGLDLDLERSRILLCGNPGMVSDMRTLLGARGYATSRRLKPGTLAVENYW